MDDALDATLNRSLPRSLDAQGHRAPRSVPLSQVSWRPLRLGGSTSPIDATGRRVVDNPTPLIDGPAQAANDFHYFCVPPNQNPPASAFGECVGELLIEINGALDGLVQRRHEVLVGFGNALFEELVQFGLGFGDHGVYAAAVGGDLVGDRLGNRTGAGRTGSEEEFSRDYFSDPYSRYRVTGTRSGSVTEFGVPFNDDRLGAKDQVVGIVANGQAKAYAREAMIQQRLFNDVVGGVPVLVAVSPAGEIKFFERSVPAGGVLEFSLENDQLVDNQGNAWDFEGLAISGPLTGTRLNPIIATPSFWFAWVSFNPNTELFEGNDEAS